jgi:hypothetical protein
MCTEADEMWMLVCILVVNTRSHLLKHVYNDRIFTLQMVDQTEQLEW